MHAALSRMLIAIEARLGTARRSARLAPGARKCRWYAGERWLRAD